MIGRVLGHYRIVEKIGAGGMGEVYIYDNAVVEALSGDTNKALSAIREALEKHYPAQFIAGDPELGSLRDRPEFKSLIQKYSEKSAAPATPTP